MATSFGGSDRGWMRHWLFRYGVALACFGATLGLSVLLSRGGIKLNLTIPIVLAVVATGWWGGKGPGLLLAVLFEGVTTYYTPVQAGNNVPQAIFQHLSIFSLYVFLAFLVSGLRDAVCREREQRDLLQTTLTSIGDAVVTTDARGAVTFLNPVAERMTGWTLAQAEGRPLAEVVRIVNEDSGEPVANPVEKVLASGTVVGLANHSMLVARDGREIPIEDSAAPIVEGGRVHGVVMVMSDVSARRQVERSSRESKTMRSLIDAQEAERHRIARDLHDHLGQRMTALRLQIGVLEDKCRELPEICEIADAIQKSARQIDRDIAFLSWELRPTELEQLGLENALSSYVREWSAQYGIEAEFHASSSEPTRIVRLPERTETNLYRMVQEALNNTQKHAEASRVNVLLRYGRDELVLVVEDDGRGFEEPIHITAAEAPGGGLGLVGMRERAEVLNGSFELDTEPGRGTTVIGRVPYPAETRFTTANAAGA